MVFFVKALAALPAKTTESKRVAWAYAVILIVLAVCQLFTFEKFPNLIESFWLPGGQPFAHFLSAFIVVAEVFSIPFLLRMKLSPAMRFLCMLLSWLVPVIWLGLSLWLVLTVNVATNTGFLGATIGVTPGWWAVCVSIALGILSAWASWGLWPLRSKK